MLWMVLLLAAITLFCSGQCSGQQQIPTPGQTSSQPARASIPGADQGFGGDQEGWPYRERRLRELNVAQHKSMVSDTEKLLKLVTELNAEISSKSPASLTPEQLRKVAEIEKLAHSVKDKMRDSVQGTPTFMDTAPTLAVPTVRH